MEGLFLSFATEIFTEGYARLFLRFGEIVARHIEEDLSGYLVNVNRGFKVFTGEVIHDLAPHLTSLKIVNVDYAHLQYIFGFLSEIVRKFDIIVVGWTPHPEVLSLTRSLVRLLRRGSAEKTILIAFSRNYLIRLIRTFTSLERGISLTILNPFISKTIRGIKLLKVHPPPLDPLIYEIMDCKIKPLHELKGVSETVVFRVMGRYRGVSGLSSIIKAFESLRYKRIDASLNAKLIIDQFLEEVDRDFLVQRNGIELHLGNPLKENIKPLRVFWETILKYISSTYTILPFVVEQFVQPPLTLLESLALGTPVIATPTVLRFFPYRDLTFQINTLDVKSTAKIFEELYELYMYNYREYHKLSEKAVATMRSLYEETVSTVARVLKE